MAAEELERPGHRREAGQHRVAHLLPAVHERLRELRPTRRRPRRAARSASAPCPPASGTGRRRARRAAVTPRTPPGAPTRGRGAPAACARTRATRCPPGRRTRRRRGRSRARVSSADLTAPPGASAASQTTTDRPASASRIAAASPFGPAPMTTASGHAAASWQRRLFAGCVAGPERVLGLRAGRSRTRGRRARASGPTSRRRAPTTCPSSSKSSRRLWPAPMKWPWCVVRSKPTQRRARPRAPRAAPRAARARPRGGPTSPRRRRPRRASR